MTKPTLTIEGAKLLQRRLKAAQRGIDGLRKIHKSAAELVGEEAAKLVPVRTGRLQATIRASGTNAGGVVRAGTALVPYAAPIHFGWAKRNISPQPFLYDALDHRREEVLEMYELQVKELLRQEKLT